MAAGAAPGLERHDEAGSEENRKPQHIIAVEKESYQRVPEEGLQPLMGIETEMQDAVDIAEALVPAEAAETRHTVLRHGEATHEQEDEDHAVGAIGKAGWIKNVMAEPAGQFSERSRRPFDQHHAQELVEQNGEANEKAGDSDITDDKIKWRSGKEMARRQRQQEPGTEDRSATGKEQGVMTQPQDEFRGESADESGARAIHRHR